MTLPTTSCNEHDRLMREAEHDIPSSDTPRCEALDAKHAIEADAIIPMMNAESVQASYPIIVRQIRELWGLARDLERELAEVKAARDREFFQIRAERLHCGAMFREAIAEFGLYDSELRSRLIAKFEREYPQAPSGSPRVAEPETTFCLCPIGGVGVCYHEKGRICRMTNRVVPGEERLMK